MSVDTNRLDKLQAVAQERPDDVDLRECLDLFERGTARDRDRVADIFLALAEHNPETIERVIEQLEPLVGSHTDQTRNAAVSLLAVLADAHPERVVPAVDCLEPRLKDTYALVRLNAARALASVASAAPEAVAGSVPALRLLLESPVPSDRAEAVPIVQTVSQEVPRAIVPIADLLLDIIEESDISETDPFAGFDDERLQSAKGDVEDAWETFEAESLEKVQTRAILTGSLVRAVKEAPAAFVGTDVPRRLVSIIDDSDPSGTLHECALEALGAIVEYDPGAIDRIEPLAATFAASDNASDAHIRVVQVLGMLAEDRPEAVSVAIEHVETVLKLLDYDDPSVRSMAALLLSYAAEQEPEAVQPAEKRLIDCLADDDPLVRASGATALGFLRSEQARTRLEDVADSDPDPKAREAATDALGRLDDLAF